MNTPRSATSGVSLRNYYRAAPLAPHRASVRGGGAALKNAQWGEGASTKRFDLCRCGQSTNKPFCSGAHWYHHFDEQAPKRD